MRTTVMYGAGDVRVEDLPDPRIQAPTDAIVRVVRSCVCGSDLHRLLASAASPLAVGARAGSAPPRPRRPAAP
jgi:threonine dehydrogenase-like Zn-dependent dehydrogenase